MAKASWVKAASIVELSLTVDRKERVMKNAGTDAKRIPVVEDEPSISQVCLRVLTGEGFEVDVADDGDIDQNMLGKRDYALCMVDTRTPAMNGKQLYQHMLEEHPELAGRPFLAKPFTPTEPKNIVNKVLRQNE